MENKNPFTEDEQKCLDALLFAHKIFKNLERTHPSELNEWVSGMHTLQGLLMHRVVRRDYPDRFNTDNKGAAYYPNSDDFYKGFDWGRQKHPMEVKGTSPFYKPVPGSENAV